MKAYNKKLQIGAALLFSFVITGLYFALIYKNFPIIYEINDDVAMRNVAAGVITGTPDAHLIFVKYLLGLVIAGFYRIFPGWDWYGIVLLGAILLSLAMVLYRGLVSDKSRFWKLWYVVITLLLFTCIGMQHIIAFQFTVAAAFAGAAGIFLFYTAEAEEQFQIILEEGISVFLLLLCLLIRESVFLMVFPVAALCFWWKYGSLDFKKKCPLVLRHWAVPLSLLVGMLVIGCSEKAAYSGEDWQAYLAFNEDRSSIMDYYGLLNYEENAEFYEEMDLSAEQVENLQRYSLYLTDEVYPEKMHELAVNAKEIQLEPYSFREQIFTGAAKVWAHWKDDIYAPLHVLNYLLLAITFLFCLFKDRKQSFLLVLLTGLMALLWLYLGYKGRIVDRVGYAMYLVSMVSTLAVLYRVEGLIPVSLRKKEFLHAAGLVLVCLALTFCAKQKWNEVKGQSTWRSTYNQEFLCINDYMAQHPENVYFMTTFSIETYTDNFTLRRDFAFSNLLSVGGWHTFSPLENEKCEKLGISVPKEDIVQKDNVYVISLENVNLRYMDRYYTSVYGDRYQGRTLVEALNYGGNTFEVYDFTIGE